MTNHNLPTELRFSEILHMWTYQVKHHTTLLFSALSFCILTITAKQIKTYWYRFSNSIRVRRHHFLLILFVINHSIHDDVRSRRWCRMTLFRVSLAFEGDSYWKRTAISNNQSTRQVSVTASLVYVFGAQAIFLN